MKKAFLLSLCFICLIVSGCSTHSAFSTVNKEISISENATFKNISVDDQSGHIWGDDEDKINISETMKNALDKYLLKDNMLGEDYLIKTTIIKYEPGNAFSRWLVPGMGATILNTKSEIYTKDNILLAIIPVERSISAGGGYTVGAWKTVFDDVAQEIVKVLKKETRHE